MTAPSAVETTLIMPMLKDAAFRWASASSC
jgi:hypothetical protein